MKSKQLLFVISGIVLSLILVNLMNQSVEPYELTLKKYNDYQKIPPILRPAEYKSVLGLNEKINNTQNQITNIKTKYAFFIALVIIFSLMGYLFSKEKIKVNNNNPSLDKINVENIDIKDKLRMLDELKNAGIITEEEYKQNKEKVFDKYL